MNVFLWIVQAVLAASFAASGLAKLTRPKGELAGRYSWMETYSRARCGASACWRCWVRPG